MTPVQAVPDIRPPRGSAAVGTQSGPRARSEPASMVPESKVDFMGVCAADRLEKHAKGSFTSLYDS
jgi:hypothetical protein